MENDKGIIVAIGIAYVGAIAWGVYNTYLLAAVNKSNRQILAARNA